MSGYFWVPERPDARVWGTFAAEGGHEPEAVLAGGLVNDARVRSTGAGGRVFMSSAAATVKAFQSITLQGQLDTGHAVTLVNAYNHGRDGTYFGSPHYKANYAVLGDRHVSGVDQLFSAMRFRFGDPYWLGHLRESKASAVGSDGSALSVETADDGNWLVYTAAAPATLRQLETRVVSGCLALAELALDQDLPPGTRTCGSMTAILGLASTDPGLTRPRTSSTPTHCCLGRNSQSSGSRSGSRSTTHWTGLPPWWLARSRRRCRLRFSWLHP